MQLAFLVSLIAFNLSAEESPEFNPDLDYAQVKFVSAVRSLSRVELPEGQRFLEISAKCTRHEFEGRRILVDLETEEGEDYRVKLK